MVKIILNSCLRILIVFFYEIKTEDSYKAIAPDVHEKFDTSDYPKDHKSGIESGLNKKVIGMFKDELGGKPATEFVGIRAKNYAYLMGVSDKETGKIKTETKKKCKGISKAVIKNKILFENYKSCFFDNEVQMREINVFRSRGHTVYTESVNKIALSADDDKRIIREDKISTFAYGHYLAPYEICEKSESESESVSESL